MCGIFFSPDREFIIDKAAFAINDRAYDPNIDDPINRDIKFGKC